MKNTFLVVALLSLLVFVSSCGNHRTRVRPTARASNSLYFKTWHPYRRWHGYKKYGDVGGYYFRPRHRYVRHHRNHKVGWFGTYDFSKR